VYLITVIRRFLLRAARSRRPEDIAMATNEGRSHSEMANEIFGLIKTNDKESPLADAGALYRYERRSGLWVRHELDAIARFVGGTINERNCKKVADYRGIAQLVYSNARDGIAHDVALR
jgi:hypothetical protein